MQQEGVVDDFPRHILPSAHRVKIVRGLWLAASCREGSSRTLLTALRFMNLMATASSVSVSLARTTKPKAPALRSLKRVYLVLPCAYAMGPCRRVPPGRAPPAQQCIQTGSQVRSTPHRQRVGLSGFGLAHLERDGAATWCTATHTRCLQAAEGVLPIFPQDAGNPLLPLSEHLTVCACAKLRQVHTNERVRSAALTTLASLACHLMHSYQQGWPH